MTRGAELIAEIAACRLVSGQGAFWWLGQHSFVVRLGSVVLHIDPFLTPLPRRNVPPLLAPADLADAALILGTHDHGDHIDRPAWPGIAESATHAAFVVPDLLRERLARDLGIPLARLVGLDDGRSVEIAGLRVTGVAAAHEFLDRDPASGRYPYLGYVIEGNGVTLYHSGDCCVYEGLQTKLKRCRLDVAMLPINGRDARRLRRGCIGNMTYQEAADLAGALRPGLTVPTHFDMFDGNTENPALFADYMAVKYPDLRTLVPQHGVGCRFGKSSP